MLSGKKFPMNVRALRIVVIELLRDVIDTTASHDEIHLTLELLSSNSKLAKHWINNLIHPVLVMMLYIRAEREGDFPLHLYACREMLPYFFAAGHWNYARDGTAYLRMMESLPKDLLESFLQGEHVVHLTRRLVEWDLDRHGNRDFIYEDWERSLWNNRTHNQ